jgi:DNA polymerase delta subunit 1
MIAHNICFSTLVNPNLGGGLNGVPIEQSSEGFSFVKKEHFEGILPNILKNLLAARKHARSSILSELDPGKKAFYDGKQKALKAIINCVSWFYWSRKW